MKNNIKFSKIIGQKKIINLLKSLISKKKIYFSFLFHGIDGTGKKNVAIALAATFNCENKKKFNKNIDACGKCNSCNLIKLNNHPDIIYIVPKNNIISVSTIRDVLYKAKLKPFKGKCNFIIIENAEKINLEASNSLLKFLEEPYQKTSIIILTSNYSKLLKTIQSRCQKLNFRPINTKKIKNYLIENNISKNLQKIILNYSYGSLKYIKKIINDKNWNNKRIWTIKNFSFILSNKEIYYKKWMILSEILYNNKKYIQEILIIIKIMLKDSLIYKYNKNKIINIDCKKSIARISKKLNSNIIINHLTNIQKTQSKIKNNYKLKLILDIMFIKINQINNLKK